MAKTDGRFSTVIRTCIRDRFFDEPDKGTLVNDLLEGHYGLSQIAHRAEMDISPPTRGFSQVPVTTPTPFVPRPPDPETGYPCCTQKRPCKHWQWDANRALYTNVLTGKEREPDIV